MERNRFPMEEVQKRIANVQSLQDQHYWEDVETSQIDLEMGGLPVDHWGRLKEPRAEDSNDARHNDNMSIFTGWHYGPDGKATYYRSGVPCPNTKP